MRVDLKPFSDYLHCLQNNLASAKNAELSHYPALKALMESAAYGIATLNDPRRIECGAPDFVVSKGAMSIGYIKAEREFAPDGGKAANVSDIHQGVAISIMAELPQEASHRAP